MGLWAAGIFPWLVGVLGIIFFTRIYFDMLDRMSVKWLFWVLVASYGIGTIYAGHIMLFLAPGVFWSIFVFSFLVLLFGVLGTGNFLFEDKVAVYALVHTAVSFVHIFFFGMLSLSVTWMWSIGLFIGMTLIMREFFVFFKVFSETKSKVFGLVFALLSVELMFLTAFLPLGFMNMAIFVTLFLFALRNIMVLYAEKVLINRIFFREIAIFTLLSLLIFATVRWTI